VGPSELILVRRLRRRDRDACRELIRRFHASVYGYLRRMGADPSLAEDFTQETYARAWQRIGTLREAASLRSWLLAIARNEFLQGARGKDPEPSGLEDVPEPAAPGPGAEDALALAERDRQIHRAVRRLEATLREAIVLHYFQDLSLREVGAVLGIPAGTAKSRVNRALACLRGLLQKETDYVGREPDKATAGGP
jgi:RNA polymerase sigma-70 factor (ECF subfamily)